MGLPLEKLSIQHFTNRVSRLHSKDPTDGSMFCNLRNFLKQLKQHCTLLRIFIRWLEIQWRWGLCMLQLQSWFVPWTLRNWPPTWLEVFFSTTINLNWCNPMTIQIFQVGWKSFCSNRALCHLCFKGWTLNWDVLVNHDQCLLRWILAEGLINKWSQLCESD